MSSAAAFRRDRTTLLAYAALASYTFCLYAPGPMLAFLRDELHLSYTLTRAFALVLALVALALLLLWMVSTPSRPGAVSPEQPR